MTATKQPSAEDLTPERVRYLVEQIKSVIPHLDELAGASDEIRDQIQKQIADYALSIRTTKLKPEALDPLMFLEVEE